MQKKIVAAICAAALALALPAAAFATTLTQDSQAEVNGSNVNYTISKLSGDKADLKNLTVFANKDMVKSFEANPTSENAVFIGGSNVIATQSFQLDAVNKNGVKIGLVQTEANVADNNITGTIEFKWDDVISTLPATIDTDNLYTSIYARHAGDNNVEVLNANVKGYSAGFSMDRCSIVTAVLSNGKVIYNPGVGVTADGATTADDLLKAAADGSKSPKTGDIA